jgi:single-strand DNA-binding protein
MNINKVMLLGRVGKDPEVRYLENGVAVARLTLATSESYKKDGEKITVTEWHNVVAWRGVAEIIEKYVKKGSEIYIEGKLKQRTWEDNEGKKRYITEINVENLQLGRRPEDSTNEANNATYQNTASSSQATAATTTTQKNESASNSSFSDDSDDMDTFSTFDNEQETEDDLPF